MSSRRRAAALAAVLAPAATALAVAAPAQAAQPGAVYVLSNQVAGNAVLTYARADDGSLHLAGSVATGGLGTGGGLGSQGAVVLDRSGEHLYAVNSGSDSVTAFRVTSHGLQTVGTVAAGAHPVSVTVHDDLVYVLDAGGAGGITGFRTDDGVLTPLPGSARGLSGSGVGPAQVSFSPDGSTLLVTEKATQKLDVYAVQDDGTTTGPVVAASAGATPFGFAFDNKGHAVVSEAFGGTPDASAVSSYDVTPTGVTTVSASVPTTETAACWVVVTADGRYAYAGNGGSASVSGYRVAPDGSLRLLTADGKTGTAPAGVTDLALSRDSHTLYGRIGNGTVATWRVARDGSLSSLGVVGGLPAGAAGIAAR
jgi:6-phosphogluconolactonase (cycloisomerase 2 family)